MQWWSSPVHVAVSNRLSVAVTSTERAAELLLYEWPGEDTDRVRTARRALLRAMERQDDSRRLTAARKAFAAAADEAGILMDEPPKSLALANFKSPSWRKRKR